MNHPVLSPNLNLDHYYVWLNARPDLCSAAHTASQPAAILSSLATWDGRAEQHACCVHMAAQCCGRRRVRDEKQREREGERDRERGALMQSRESRGEKL